ncbi:MAG: DnaJ domain-containing protein [Chloroflexota bacterium]|nr:MAG: molecular chaperone DnaJ [Chloroflexota bacterium]
MNCPSCAAPLDAEGVCTACGALSATFFHTLDLGPPQVAAAVANGLDFYQLLGVQPSATVRQVARRYRKLRVLFPDDPSQLAAEPARRLALLETAGRTLTDPALRRLYDELRAAREVELRTAALRCPGCSAPVPPEMLADGARRSGTPRCAYCGTPLPSRAAPPPAPPADGPPAAEPVDYYGLLGLHPAHLVAGPADPDAGRLSLFPSAGPRLGEHTSLAEIAAPPTAEEVDAAAYTRERELLLAPGLPADVREARAAEVDTARRILRDERLRARYDTLWRAFQRGTLNAGHLEALAALQEEVRPEITSAAPSEAEAHALLGQGRGYLEASLPRDAIEPLRRAVQALPGSAEAHATYARAILASADPLDLGAHMLRQALASLERSEALGAAPANSRALVALCRGLLARDAGDPAAAEAELQRAVREDGRLAAAWRALAALALGRAAYQEAIACCRRALAVERRDQRALLMLAAACLRGGQRREAESAAAEIAALRGAGWTAAEVLREIG